jgi:hypothetical protein
MDNHKTIILARYYRYPRDTSPLIAITIAMIRVVVTAVIKILQELVVVSNRVVIVAVVSTVVSALPPHAALN